ncbi:hypothetical protein ACFL35_20430 [Candidatus Riflebacteria bacterium]
MKKFRFILILISLFLLSIYGCSNIRFDKDEEDFPAPASFTILGKLKLPDTVLDKFIKAKISLKISARGFKVELRFLNLIEKETETDDNGQFTFVKVPWKDNFLLALKKGRIQLYSYINTIPQPNDELEIDVDLLSTARALVVQKANREGKNLSANQVLADDVAQIVSGYKNILSGDEYVSFLSPGEVIPDKLSSEIEAAKNLALERQGLVTATSQDLARATAVSVDRTGDGNPDSPLTLSLTEGIGAFGQQVFYYDFTPSGLIGGHIPGRIAQKAYKFIDKDNKQLGALVFSAIPGETGYSDLIHIFEVIAPENYKTDSLTDSRDIEKSGYSIRDSGAIFNTPVVPVESKLLNDPKNRSLQNAWYRGYRLSYFVFGTYDADILSRPTKLGKVYVPVIGSSNSAQKNIFRYVPPNDYYGDLHIGYSLATSTSILRLSQAMTRFSDITSVKTGVEIETNAGIFNYPIVKVEDEKARVQDITSRDSFFSLQKGLNTNGNPLFYYDFGTGIASPSIVYLFYDSEGKKTQNRPVFERIPGASTYSDFLRLRKVTLKENHHSDSIKSIADITALGLGYATTTVVLNYPILPPGSLLADDPVNRNFQSGWYETRKVYFYEFENSSLDGILTTTSPFLSIDTTAIASGQLSFFSGMPGETNYSDLKKVFVVSLASASLVKDVLDFATTRTPVAGAYTPTAAATAITASSTRKNLPIVKVTPVFSDIYSNIFAKTCAISACHTGIDPAGSLNLSTASAYQSLVNVDSYQNPDKKRVKAGEPEKSYLIEKLTGSGLIGERMPKGSSTLSEEQLNKIKDWILQGALNL